MLRHWKLRQKLAKGTWNLFRVTNVFLLPSTSTKATCENTPKMKGLKGRNEEYIHQGPAGFSAFRSPRNE